MAEPVEAIPEVRWQRAWLQTEHVVEELSNLIARHLTRGVHRHAIAEVPVFGVGSIFVELRELGQHAFMGIRRPAHRLVIDGARASLPAKPGRRQAEDDRAVHGVVDGVVLVAREQGAATHGRLLRLQLSQTNQDRRDHRGLAGPWRSLDERDVRCVERLVDGVPLCGRGVEAEDVASGRAERPRRVGSAHGGGLVLQDQRKLRNTGVRRPEAQHGLFTPRQSLAIPLQGTEEVPLSRWHHVRVLIEGPQQDLIAIPPDSVDQPDEGAIPAAPLNRSFCIRQLCGQVPGGLELLAVPQALLELGELLLASDLEGPET